MDLDISNEGVVLQRGDGTQDMKIQAKGCPQGGLFQMEPEPGITETNTLGPDFTHEAGTPGQDGPLCFTNGRFSGYDSPELATRSWLTRPRSSPGTSRPVDASAWSPARMPWNEDATPNAPRKTGATPAGAAPAPCPLPVRIPSVDLDINPSGGASLGP